MRPQSRDTDLAAEAVQLDLLRGSTVARRVSTAVSLSRTTIGLVCGALRRQNPAVTDAELLVRFVAIHHGPDLAEALRMDMVRRAK